MVYVKVEKKVPAPFHLHGRWETLTDVQGTPQLFRDAELAEIYIRSFLETVTKLGTTHSYQLRVALLE